MAAISPKPEFDKMGRYSEEGFIQIFPSLPSFYIYFHVKIEKDREFY